MNPNKPYRGEIHEWRRVYFDRDKFKYLSETLGYCISGVPHGHPQLINWVITSAVVDYDETTGEIETRYSVYKLVPPRNTASPKK